MLMPVRCILLRPRLLAMVRAFAYPPPDSSELAALITSSVCTTRGNWEESHVLDALPCEPVRTHAFEQLIVCQPAFQARHETKTTHLADVLVILVQIAFVVWLVGLRLCTV